MQLPAAKLKDVSKLHRSAQQVTSGPLPNREDIRKRLSYGYSLRATAMFFRVSLSTLRRIHRS